MSVTFHRLTEDNEWEGERWYHYFLDGPEVLSALEYAKGKENSSGVFADFLAIETISMTWKEAERLTNLDEETYMQCHWFGELTNIEGLKNATLEELYKGGIRNFGEELFEV